jgi:hypothetical protein
MNSSSRCAGVAGLLAFSVALLGAQASPTIIVANNIHKDCDARRPEFETGGAKWACSDRLVVPSLARNVNFDDAVKVIKPVASGTISFFSGSQQGVAQSLADLVKALDRPSLPANGGACGSATANCDAAVVVLPAGAQILQIGYFHQSHQDQANPVEFGYWSDNMPDFNLQWAWMHPPVVASDSGHKYVIATCRNWSGYPPGTRGLAFGCAVGVQYR